MERPHANQLTWLPTALAFAALPSSCTRIPPMDGTGDRRPAAAEQVAKELRERFVLAD